MTHDANNLSDAGQRHLCYVAVGLALVVFGCLFLCAATRFWVYLALSVAALCAVALIMEREPMRAALRNTGGYGAFQVMALGLASAAILYVVFLLGNIAARALLPFGGAEIEAVYGLGATTPRWVIAVLLILVVGPGEEFFWRGYVQRRLSAEFGWSGLAASVLAYGGAHVVTCNLMLILAALVCGSFWALLYHRYHSLRINMISHAAWAVTIFVLCPMS